jgi:hypothetical protein
MRHEYRWRFDPSCQNLVTVRSMMILDGWLRQQFPPFNASVVFFGSAFSPRRLLVSTTERIAVSFTVLSSLTLVDN